MAWLSNLGRGALAFATGGLSELAPLAMGSDLGESIPFLGAGESNRRNREFAKEQFKYQKKVDARNFANVDRAFNEQAYLNRNGMQIQASDAQKAGINPLAMSSGSLSTVSANNVSTSTVNGNQSVVDNTSALLSLIGMANDKSMNKSTNKTQIDTTKLNNDTALKINENDNQTKKDIAMANITSEEKRHEERIDMEKDQFNRNLEVIKEHNDNVDLVARETADAINALRRIELFTSKQELYEKVLSLAERTTTFFSSKSSSVLEKFGYVIGLTSLKNQGNLTPEELAGLLYYNITGERYGDKED